MLAGEQCGYMRVTRKKPRAGPTLGRRYRPVTKHTKYYIVAALEELTILGPMRSDGPSPQGTPQPRVGHALRPLVMLLIRTNGGNGLPASPDY